MLSEQVHHVGGELLAALEIYHFNVFFNFFFGTDLVIFFQLLVVDVPNLTKLGLIVAVLYGGLWREGWGWREALDSKNSLPTPNIQG